MEKTKNRQPYYIGLDIGTSSVGWAVTDLDYRLRRFNRKTMWGVRLFEKANTAAKRRTFRVNRRRLTRRRERLGLLKDLFAAEINKIDPHFFKHLEESKLHLADKTVAVKHPLFHNRQAEQQYYEQYPTIYHLRHALMTDSAPHDVRLVYLALHHIVKYRGHFLFEGTFSMGAQLEPAVQALNDSVRNLFQLEEFIPVSMHDTLDAVFSDESMTRSDKGKCIEQLLLSTEENRDSKNFVKEFTKLVTGQKCNLKKLFLLDAEDAVTIEFAAADFEDVWIALAETLRVDERLFIEQAKALHDYGKVRKILGPYDSLSEAKKAAYDTHHKNLKKLKEVFKMLPKEDYKAFFRDESGKINNYPLYIGQIPKKNCTWEAFKKCCQSYLDKAPQDNQKVREVVDTLTLSNHDTFLPKQRGHVNGEIPHQIHESELKTIVNNAKRYLPFLNETDAHGQSVAEKIELLFRFKIPYYVGPLNPDSSHAWVVRQQRGAVTPWNFDKMIDCTASAERFITRMTNDCTYLLKEPVLPKASPMYEKFSVLNIINKIKIDGQPISVADKQALFEALFVKSNRKVTRKRVHDYLIRQNLATAESELSGIDQEIPVKLNTFHGLETILGPLMSRVDVVEEIVRLITLFHDDTKMLRSKLVAAFPDDLSADQIKRLTTKRYQGWGRLSRQFLVGIVDAQHFLNPTGVLQALWETNHNLMELLAQDYDFTRAIAQYNAEREQPVTGLSYSLVDELYVSPAVKRSLWQTLQLVDEIVRISGQAPQRIFLEVAREKGKKVRTESRLNHLKELYRSCKEETALIETLNNEPEERLRSKKLYLYYTQLGRCMYSGEEIDYPQLFDDTVYNVDHIFPRSLTKDDSLDNLVLVKLIENKKKDDRYPISASVQQAQQGKWQALSKNGFISKEKFERLMRKDPLTEDELAGFIARQLVETRQSSKAAADLLKKLYPETEIVYVKARHVTDFRQDYKFVKNRNINDYHHAKDAFLNIVVGNVYHTRFTSDPRNFVRQAGYREYNLKTLFHFDVARNNVCAWVGGSQGTIVAIRQTMARNDILVTRPARMGKGELFDQTMMPKGEGQIPLKKGLPINQYGGYNKATVSHFLCVDSLDKKGKRMRTLEAIPLLIKQASEETILAYLQEAAELREPRIVYGPIPKTDTLIEWDGKRAYITGKGDNRILYRNAKQLLVTVEQEYLFKQMDQCLERKQEEKLAALPLDELYDVLLAKAEHSAYQKLVAALLDLLRNGKAVFSNLSPMQKAAVLKEILELFRCASTKPNLTLINGSKITDINRFSKNISNIKSKSFVIIHQSVTGLYEQRIDLMQL